MMACCLFTVLITVCILQVIVNLYSVLYDPEVFPDPKVLKPERFLDDEGQATRHEHWVPFSMGKMVVVNSTQSLKL